jgi:hypothetical protein
VDDNIESRNTRVTMMSKRWLFACGVFPCLFAVAAIVVPVSMANADPVYTNLSAPTDTTFAFNGTIFADDILLAGTARTATNVSVIVWNPTAGNVGATATGYLYANNAGVPGTQIWTDDVTMTFVPGANTVSFTIPATPATTLDNSLFLGLSVDSADINLAYTSAAPTVGTSSTPGFIWGDGMGMVDVSGDFLNASVPGSIEAIYVASGVPEPGTFALAAMGLVALGFFARRRRAA